MSPPASLSTNIQQLLLFNNFHRLPHEIHVKYTWLGGQKKGLELFWMERERREKGKNRVESSPLTSLLLITPVLCVLMFLCSRHFGQWRHHRLCQFDCCHFYLHKSMQLTQWSFYVRSASLLHLHFFSTSIVSNHHIFEKTVPPIMAVWIWLYQSLHTHVSSGNFICNNYEHYT